MSDDEEAPAGVAQSGTFRRVASAEPRSATWRRAGAASLSATLVWALVEDRSAFHGARVDSRPVGADLSHITKAFTMFNCPGKLSFKGAIHSARALLFDRRSREPA